MTLLETRIVEDDHPVVYFLSDVHLGGSPQQEEEEKRRRLLSLVERVGAEGASLYVLGDLFDFWFEYQTVIPKTAMGILARLDRLAETTDVRYLGGNHDFWIHDFFLKETRIQVLPDAATLTAQGRTARLFHGDGLAPGDTGYKVLKKVLRNPLAIRMFRWLHPDLGIPLAMRSSGLSRGHTGSKAVDVEALYRHVALPEFERGADAVLMGHHHVPIHWTRERGDFLILGDWFQNYTCVRLRGGAFELLRWPLD